MAAICANCKHCSQRAVVHICTHPDHGKLNYVTGYLEPAWCLDFNDKGQCRKFEERPPFSLVPRWMRLKYGMTKFGEPDEVKT